MRRVLTVALVVACGRDQPPAPAAEVEPATAGPTTPRTRAEFLGQLIPQPGGDLIIVYDARGPAGMTGTLELISRAGGLRRENFTLELPVPEQEPRRIEGTTIQTFDRIWTATGSEPGVVSPSPLAALADLYVTLEPQRQGRIVESVRRWYDDREQARNGGKVSRILDTDCLELRIGAQDVCLWEATGVPLRYSGAAFSLTATRIERDAKLGDQAFVLPAAAGNAREVPLAASMRIDPHVALRELEDGNYAALALVLQPGLRLPLAVGD